MKIWIVITTWDGIVDDPEVFASQDEALKYQDQMRGQYMRTSGKSRDELNAMWEKESRHIDGTIDLFEREINAEDEESDEDGPEMDALLNNVVMSGDMRSGIDLMDADEKQPPTCPKCGKAYLSVIQAVTVIRRFTTMPIMNSRALYPSGEEFGDEIYVEVKCRDCDWLRQGIDLETDGDNWFLSKCDLKKGE
jgi:hypothetical protein